MRPCTPGPYRAAVLQSGPAHPETASAFAAPPQPARAARRPGTARRPGGAPRHCALAPLASAAPLAAAGAAVLAARAPLA